MAEQDFDGAGDLCIRCHSTAGWMAGRSTPTDGSGLMAGDADGNPVMLNNKVAKDNRIPTYGMSYDEARKRNALPEPATQYGNPGPGGVYNYWDEVALAPPTGAAYATIDLEGTYILEAWLNKGMAKPYVMASTTWGAAPQPVMEVSVDRLTT